MQGQLIDRTMTISKLEYVLQKNTVKFCVWIQFKTMLENQQRYLDFGPRKLLFLSVIMSDCMTVLFDSRKKKIFSTR